MQRILIVFVFAATFACTRPPGDSINMSGAYRMLSQKVITEQVDSLIEGVHQLKIYTPEFMMYVNFNEKDSLAAFGIGTYLLNANGLTENIIYSAYDSTVAGGENYNLDIEITESGYRQVIHEDDESGQVLNLTENYETVSLPRTTSLDGAWKQMRTFNIEEGDTTDFEVTQYKTYYAGHFMFGFTFKDSMAKTHTGMGFGNFEMINDNQAREVVTTSTLNIVGNTFDIDLQFDGPDKFTQIITDTSGIKSYEVYERLKTAEIERPVQ